MNTSSKKTVGIIGAMDSEVAALKSKISHAETKTISGIDFVYGEICNVNIVVAKCGIGKVFAAICAQSMILSFFPDIIINIGVAGALADDLKIKDVAIADCVVQHDMDTTALGDPPGLISGLNTVCLPCSADIVNLLVQCVQKLGISYRVGTIASGDCFVQSSEKKKYIKETFNAVSCEMEGGSIGHVCTVNGVPFGILRAMSDNGDENADSDYTVSLEEASDVALSVVEEYLNLLC